MIVVEPVPVHRTAVLTRGNFRHSTDEIIPHFRKITDAVHAHGTVICHQLYHVGQHGDFDNSYEPSWSPSRSGRAMRLRSTATSVPARPRWRAP